MTSMDRAFATIDGFAASNIRGNAVRLPVLWQGGKTLESLEGRTIKLRFELDDAELCGLLCRQACFRRRESVEHRDI